MRALVMRANDAATSSGSMPGVRPSSTLFGLGPTMLLALLLMSPRLAWATGDEAPEIMPKIMPEIMIVEIDIVHVAKEFMETPTLKDEPGIPVILVLEWLEVAYEIGEGGQLITGHLAGRPFELHGTRLLRYRGMEHALDESEAGLFEGEIYLAPRVWSELLDVDFRYQPGRLRVVLQPDDRLPVYRRRRMMLARRYREPIDREPAEHQFLAASTPFGGHVLDWRAGAGVRLFTTEDAYADWGLAYGGEVLGGAIRASSSGSTSQPIGSRSGQLSWSGAYDLDGIREVRLGTFFSPGPTTQHLVGGMITNAPVYQHRAYGHADVPLDLPPGTPVDVYLDGVFLEHGDIGPDGHYEVRAPLQYGHNRLEVRYLDEIGEYQTRSLLLRVPRNMLREGELQYHVATGLDRYRMDQGVGLMQFGWGVTPWLSIIWGSEVLFGSPDIKQGAFPYATGVLRLHRNAHLELRGGPRGGVGTTLDLASAAGLRLVASHDEQRYTPAGYPLSRSSSALRINAPFHLGDMPAGFSLNAAETRFGENLRLSSVRSTVMLRTRRAGQILTGYFWQGDLFGGTRTNGEALLRWSRALPGDLPGGLLRLGFSVDPHDLQLSSITAAWGRYLQRLFGLRVQLGYTFQRSDILGDSHEIGLGLQKNFDEAWTRADVGTSRFGPPRLDVRAGGSSSYMPEDQSLTFDRRPQVDRGRMLIRMDSNPLQERSYNVIVDGRRQAIDKDGKAAIGLLTRERTYRVHLESTPRADPLQAPRYTEFDVRARANRTVVIDIPVDETFELEGYLFLEPSPGARRGLGSARVRLIQEDGDESRLMTTFLDGFLYEYGLRPGSWRLEPDAGQLAARGYEVRPRLIRIEHSPEAGVALYDRNFFLAGPPETMTSEALARRIWDALLEGEQSSASAVSSVMLHEAPDAMTIEIGEICGPLQIEQIETLEDRLGDDSLLLALNSKRAGSEACMKLSFGLFDHAAEAEARAQELEESLGPDLFGPPAVVSVQSLLYQK